MEPRFPGQAEVTKLNLKQIQTLISVACSEVFDSLSPIDPRSAREVAKDIGRSPASVGEQIVKLMDAELVISAGTRKRRSRTETLFAHAGRLTRFMLAEQTPESIEQYKQAIRWGIDCIQTDHPLRVLRAIEQLSNSKVE